MDKKVVIDVAKDPSHDYPFAVYVQGPKRKYQEWTCKNLRECQILANGIVEGMAVGLEYGADCHAEIVWSERVVKP